MQHYHRGIVVSISPQKNLTSGCFDPPSARPALGAVHACQSPPSQKFVADVDCGTSQPALTSRKPFISLIQPEAKRRQFRLHEILSNNLDFPAAQCQKLIFAKKLKSSGSVFRLTASLGMKLQSSRSALRQYIIETTDNWYNDIQRLIHFHKSSQNRSWMVSMV